jgi:hypothetical protein
MVHSGYEASAVHDTFNSLGGFLATVKATLFSGYRDADALEDIERLRNPIRPPAGLVQLQATERKEEARV